MQYIEVINTLNELSEPENVEKMAKFGISSANTLGISMPSIRLIAKTIKINHELAIELWESGIHEAKILASLIADPKLMNESLMDKWVTEFDSWDVCDQVCGNLFDRTSYVDNKIFEWVQDDREFVRRAGFVLIACSAVHHKKRNDTEFIKYFEIITKYSFDNRNFVRKAVNWAIRQIGKRSHYLNHEAKILCDAIISAHPDNSASRWIVADAQRELNDEKILARIKR